jgi:hypothetical protein
MLIDILDIKVFLVTLTLQKFPGKLDETYVNMIVILLVLVCVRFHNWSHFLLIQSNFSYQISIDLTAFIKSHS